MKIIKKILLAILSIVILALIVALFLPNEYHVERDVTINKPKDSIFNYVKYLKNQDNFSVWAKLDPAMKKTFTGTDGTVGAISAWDSTNKNVGKGEQEIKKIVPGERLEFELRFKVPFESTDMAYMTTEAITPTQTKVKWGFDGRSPYPMNLMLAFMNMDQMLGEQLETGLQNLKIIQEGPQ
ncbi:SRPBCC family protein [Flavobacterium hydatis]|uniref:Polyketide cyclase n=1 Tax=Flavobacterium hydatis TaxID=991 RepID=A0A085ZZM2_FLAHY|nr:SRPBCC family protein [Flavobacterium hydatis]KFF09886.1 polyketide cyclase [Flavobacterium hydatis]OXA85830.1 polyketide cyclase [Flavobacterium hydatis]